jgi:hypothetical protein
MKNPRSAGLANDRVRKLFEAWWDRDLETFRYHFTQRLRADGTPVERKLAAELAADDPLPPNTFEVFGKFFTDTSKVNRITLMVNTDAAILVACSEAGMPLKIQSDCEGLPRLHLFAVTMMGLNPRSIAHIATTETIEVDKFSIWSAGAS